MAEIDDYTALVAIIESGSLTAAAHQLDRSLQAISRSLLQLERSLGVELVQRTTRRSRPTEAGMAFYRRIKAALADIALARQEATDQATELAGPLRIGSSIQFAPVHVVPALAAFLERHPAVEIDLALADPYVDLIAERIDVAIRIGDMPDSSLMARRLGDLRRVLYAAPGYLAARGRPDRPHDLVTHQCVIRTDAQAGGTLWELTDRTGAVETIAVTGRFRSSGAAACIAAAIEGLGIGLAPLWQVRDALDLGLVELVLPDHGLPPMPMHLVWPPTAKLPARTRAIVDFLAVRLATARI